MARQTRFGAINESDFSSLLDTLSANPKGRAFLAEYLRRSRPEETGSLLRALRRIEATIAAIGVELQPRRIADELSRIAMSLDIAVDGAVADPDGDEPARRMALVEQSRREIAALAQGLAGEVAPAPGVLSIGGAGESTAFDPGGAESIEDDLALADHADADWASPER